jgi:diguanylate cyclase (GGDEF)-like protein
MENHILIIDDSNVDRYIIKTIISKNIQNVKIFESEDGLDVNSIITSQNIKVCFLDLKLPLKDGYQILEELKKDSETMDVPVIVCTGIADTSSLEKVLKLGAYDYFSKPFSDEAIKISLPLKLRNAIELFDRTKNIVQISQIDSLTGIYNRSYFKANLSKYIKDLKFPISTLMCDINGLKIANDAYGSDMGDQFLIAATNIINSYSSKNSICARWGGDEFVLLFSETDKHTVEKYATEIRNAFSNVTLNGLKLSMACGCDTIINNEHTLLKALVNAEDAMFRDKILENISVRSNLIGTILKTLHEKNPREEAHSRRVSELCYTMGSVLGLSEKECKELKIMGLLHDIGKIAIDEYILNKPEKLTHEEWTEIKRHPEIGFRLLSTSPEMSIYAEAILCHHERYDGKGYPNALKAEEIHKHARILSVIDCYDAMTCFRPYKISMTDAEAAEELKRSAGTQLDPEYVQVFVNKVLGNDNF